MAIKTENPAALHFIMQDDIFLLPGEKNLHADIDVPQQVAEEETPALNINYLGSKKSNFLVLVHYPGLEFINEGHLTALGNILKRKGFETGDVAIVNIAAYGDVDFETIVTYFNPQKMLLLGESALPAGIAPLKLNALQPLGTCQALYSFSFDEMMDSPDNKPDILGTDENVIILLNMQLVFATNNAHKLEEVGAKISGNIKLLSLTDIGCFEDIAETGVTFHENASIKSRYIYNKFKLNCFGDDSGLEINALDGEPGVYSARYSGIYGDHAANMDKVLAKLSGVTNRAARFRTVISLMWNGEEYFFDGTVEGTIRTERSGTGGFGYDPIFQPDGYNITFAEMSMDEKNAISHRARAVEKLLAFLKMFRFFIMLNLF